MILEDLTYSFLKKQGWKRYLGGNWWLLRNWLKVRKELSGSFSKHQGVKVKDIIWFYSWWILTSGLFPRAGQMEKGTGCPECKAQIRHTAPFVGWDESYEAWVWLYIKHPNLMCQDIRPQPTFSSLGLSAASNESTGRKLGEWWRYEASGIYTKGSCVSNWGVAKAQYTVHKEYLEWCNYCNLGQSG